MNKSFARTSSFLTSSPWTLVSPVIPCNLANPAFRTEDEIALIDVVKALIKSVKIPVAPGYLR